MSLKPLSPRSLSSEIAAWGAKHLAEDDPYKLIGDKLYEQYHDEDFADLYHKEGKPGISPVLLSLVTVFQTLENLTDRETVKAVRTRLDWKYALHLPLDDGAFNFTVLHDFRTRLITHKAESRVFDTVLVQLKGLGFIKAHGTQRTDSLSLLSRARDLGRLEFLHATVRNALRNLLKVDEEWMQNNAKPEWAERYAKPCRTERKNAEERARLMQVIGEDGQHLLNRLATDETAEPLRDIQAISILRTVWEQQFTVENGQSQLRPNGIGAAERIETPHDPEARWSDKRGQDWIGYKLQVTETEDAGLPHLITDIAVTDATEPDSVALPDIQERQKHNDTLPGERYVDSGYVGGNTIAASKLLDEDLIGPLKRGSSPQQRQPDGLTHADFTIDFEHKQATCPQGHTTVIFTAGKRNGFQATFSIKVCRDCPLRPRCCAGKKEGRSLKFGAHYKETLAARERQKTSAFKEAYKQHRSGIEGCLSALVRGQGMRRCRYAGKAKNHLRAMFVGAGVNLARAAQWLGGFRYPSPKSGLALVRQASVVA